MRLDNNGLVRKLKRTRSKQMVAPCKYILLPEKDSNAFMLTQNSLFKPRHKQMHGDVRSCERKGDAGGGWSVVKALTIVFLGPSQQKILYISVT